jgi:hypothetical protein
VEVHLLTPAVEAHLLKPAVEAHLPMQEAEVVMEQANTVDIEQV